MRIDGKDKCLIYFNGEPVEAYTGEPVAVSLYAANIRKLGLSVKYKRPRGMYSLDFPFYMTVDGKPNINVCEIETVPDMRIELQKGRGEVHYD